MATLSSTIELQDNFSNVLNTIIGGIYRGVSAVETFQSTMNESAPTSFVDSVEAQANQATAALQQMQDAAANGTNIEVEVATSEAQQRIADIQQQFESILPIQNAINEVARNTYFMPEDTVDKLTAVNKNIQNMQGALTYLNNNKIDLDSEYAQMQIKALTEGIEAATQQQTELNAALGDIPSQVAATVNVEISVPEWQSDSLEVFTTSGVERFEQEVQSANNMLNTLNQTQSKIAAQAANTNIFPSNMVTDMNGLQSRLQAIQNRMQQIESNPLNMGTDAANAELEQLRAQLDQAVQQQQAMNDAVDNMDVEAANAAYLQLSQTVSNTERYIRDNTTEQGQFNSTIEQGVESANSLQTMIKGALAAYTGIAGIRKAVSWIQECTEAFNTQLNAENQLMVVLGNMLDADYVSQFEIEVTADTSDAVDEINAISSTIDDEVVVTVSAETKALEAEFDAITAKAAEIQSEGIYGDEAMIAAAAEFATYFSDVDAITTMMDTLADYAMGMSGGGEIDTESMVEYATNLGKIMSGSYDAMTKKGFEFTEAQEAIIEGTATQEQIIATLGEEYLDMSEDMQAAAAISQVIEESWAGLYESMSDTPEGKIIQMNNAFGDLKETIGGELYPYVILFVDAINENWSTITAVIQGIATALEFLMGVLSVVLEAALNVGSFIAENWSIISPIVYGVAAALAVYAGYLAITKAAELASAAAKVVMCIASYAHAAATGTEASATAAATAAQYSFNTALLACPLTWIVVAIIAVVAAIYLVVAAINKVTGSTISATGIIAGAFAVLGAHVLNTFVVPLWNGFASLANFFGNVFNDPVAAIKVLFYDMCLTVIGYIQNLASAIETLINKIPGVTIDITSGLDNFYSQLETAQQAVKDESGWTEYVAKMEYVDYTDAAQAGYKFGEGIEDTVSNLSLSDLFNTDDVVSAEDYLTDYDATSSLGSDVSDIADSASTVADSVDCTEEELKYLRDIAEQETVNRFTLAEVNIDQSGMQNNISNGMDLDGVVNGLTDAVNEAIDIVTEGVHD